MAGSSAKTEINKFILDAALNKEEMFDSYKRLCEIQGDMDYVDFEWKYYQYYHGNRDLSIERSPENSSPVTFSDLPMDVLEHVVRVSDLPECMMLRKVSHDLRNLVDSSEVRCRQVFFCLHSDSVTIMLGSFSLRYKRIAGGGCTIFVKRGFRNIKSFKDDRNYKQAMVADASKFLKNPKLKIGKIGFISSGISYDTGSELAEFLQSLDFQLDVRSIDFHARNIFILPILQCLKPKVLETISISADGRYWTAHRFEKLMKMEQWKLANTLNWKGSSRELQMEHFTHFKKIRIQIHATYLSDYRLEALRDILLKSAHLESWWLQIENFRRPGYGDNADSDFEDQEEGENEERINRIMSRHAAYDAQTRRFSILNSRDYFQLKFERVDGVFNALSIEKVSGI